MTTPQPAARDIDAYIAGFPGDVQAALEQVRRTIREAAPEAEEAISYRIPTFTLHGSYLVYFAGHKQHIGLYPVPGGDADFQEELSAYRAGKGTLRFPLDAPMPVDLIRKVVRFRAAENLERAAAKGKKR